MCNVGTREKWEGGARRVSDALDVTVTAYNHNILFIVLLYIIKGKKFIGLKQWIWEDPTGKMVSLGRVSYP